MKSFNYRAETSETQQIEQIISNRKKRLLKQKVIYVTVLSVLLALLGYYVFERVIYTDFDGFVKADYQDARAFDDMFMLDHYSQVGDIVVPGDTLYSYIYMENLLGTDFLYSEPSVVTGDRSIRMQTGITRNEAGVLRVKIEELEKQIAQEDHNIQFGLTDNSHKMDLQRQLAIAREELRSLEGKMSVYYTIGGETNRALERSGIAYTDDRDNELIEYYRHTNALRYMLAHDTAVVTKRWVPAYSPVFKGESILQLQRLSFENNNLRVLAYVPVDKMEKVNNHTKAEIIVNNQVRFNAHVRLLGARTEDLPEELRNSLSRIHTTAVVIFSPDDGEEVPFWAAVDNVPVTIRVHNYEEENRQDKDDYWYVNNHGLVERTLEKLGLKNNIKNIPNTKEGDAE